MDVVVNEVVGGGEGGIAGTNRDNKLKDGPLAVGANQMQAKHFGFKCSEMARAAGMLG